MAGKIIVSTLQSDTDNSISFVANTGATIFSANLSNGIAGSFIGDGSVTNAKLAGSITGDKITVGTLAGNVFTANTITGDKIGQNAISSNNIVSVNASVATVGTLPKARLPAGSVLQVVSSTKTDTFSSTTTGSWLDVTGLSVSITPTSSSSKIMIFGRITGAGEATVTRLQMRLVRDSTAISVGDASGSRLQVSGGELYYGGENDSLLNSTAFFLDSPATTSSTTYKIQIRNGNNAGTITINRTRNNNDASEAPVSTSSITVMEIAA